jgi:low temperature requirement protein LtrA
VSEHDLQREQRVSPVELFFDLVFVFGLTQVTMALTSNPTWSGLAHGLLVLATLWWAWAAYAWLTNLADPNNELVWGTMLIAMAAMFVAALAVPTAFGRHGVVFGAAFVVVSIMYLALYALSAQGDRDLLDAILRVAPWSLGGALLVLAAGFAHGAAKPALWLIALLVGFVGPLFTGVSGWHVQPAHFVERHGLIVIIAIGESLVAIGFGARETELSAGVIAAALVGFSVAASFWLAYFDFFTIRTEQLLANRTGAQRTALARDAFTYLHLPMVAGIVLFAFAMKTTLAHIGHALPAVPAVALCCGPALYLFAYVGVRMRVSGHLGGGRLAAGIACVALIPLALVVPAIVALSLMAAIWIALHAYELIWWREARAEARAPSVPAQASSR